MTFVALNNLRILDDLRLLNSIVLNGNLSKFGDKNKAKKFSAEIEINKIYTRRATSC
jgi:hypothetical protein